MLSKENNDLITQTGPGTPGGKLLRSYWQPIVTAEEMPAGGDPKPIRIMSEDLVLFRDDDNRLGLIGLHCPHRGTDLSYGRVEDGGLRCLYHGWAFDVNGNCIDQPAEPEDKKFCHKVRHTAYPVQEKGGVIWTYMGEGEPPLIPDLPFLTPPEENRAVFRVEQDCNWVQALEGSIDPSHVSYLHGMGGATDPDDPDDIDLAGVAKLDDHPSLEIQRLRYGARICALRKLPNGRSHLRVTNYVYPNATALPNNVSAGGDGKPPRGTGCGGRYYVPIDDTHHCRYEFVSTYDEPIDKDSHRARRVGNVTEDLRHVRSAANRYLQDRDEMKTKTFAGLGPYFPAHDCFAIESQGAIQDRTTEHLGVTDIAVIEMRKAIIDAIQKMQEGAEAPGLLRDPAEASFPELIVAGEYIEPDLTGPEHCDRKVAAMLQAAE
jgi:phthalate 4,5-dioxygenase oxygenase subunit